MPFIDLAVVLGVIALGIAGIGIVHTIRQKNPDAQAERMRAKGRENVKEMEREDARVCAICGKPTSAEADLFVDASWYHRDCFRSLQT